MHCWICVVGEGFLSPAEILLQLSMLAEPQLQTVAAAQCPIRADGTAGKTRQFSKKTKKRCVAGLEFVSCKKEKQFNLEFVCLRV